MSETDLNCCAAGACSCRTSTECKTKQTPPLTTNIRSVSRTSPEILITHLLAIKELWEGSALLYCGSGGTNNGPQHRATLIAEWPRYRCHSCRLVPEQELRHTLQPVINFSLVKRIQNPCETLSRLCTKGHSICNCDEE
jgi:hypothetical protein